MARVTSNSLLSVCLLAASSCGPSSKIVDAPSNPGPASANELAAQTASAVPAIERNGAEHRISGEPVTATLRLARARVKAGDEVELAVILEIAPLWEIRTLDAEAGFTATQLKLEVPGGLQSVGDWTAPMPVRSLMPDGHAAYVDEAVFTRSLRIAAEAPKGKLPIKCHVRYEACNERQCLQPTALELQVVLDIQ
jgi:hypothetical protein